MLVTSVSIGQRPLRSDFHELGIRTKSGRQIHHRIRIHMQIVLWVFDQINAALIIKCKISAEYVKTLQELCVMEYTFLKW